MTTLLLICLLGSPKYVHREVAHSVLYNNLDNVIAELVVGETSPNPEVAQRCRSMVNEWYRRHAEAMVDKLPLPGWGGKFPWIDGLQVDYESEDYYKRVNYFQEARQAVGWHGPPDWQDFRAATRLWMLDLVRQRIDVTPMFLTLCEKEREWCRNNGLTVPP